MIWVKKALAVVLAILFILSASAAGEPEQAQTASVGGVAWFIVQEGCGLDPADLERVDQTRDEETVDYYLTQVYGLEPGSWSECAIFRAGGTEAFEIAVIRMGDEKAAKAAAGTLEDYIAGREADFAGYEPEQADIVHGSLTAWSEAGDAALLICPEPATARVAFECSYKELERLPFDPPGKDDMTLYDTSSILAAWKSGDASSLSEKDAAILEMAGGVLAEVTDESMSDYARERALYGWIVSHATYDEDHYDRLATLDPDSSNPYGLMKNGKAICVGFATTFQLFMDMTGVECITVIGASRESTADHAWNMVRLDGNWYCVDSTWDESDTEEDWRYFNVTSDWMAYSNHQWDYENVPEATVTDGGRNA